MRRIAIALTLVYAVVGCDDKNKKKASADLQSPPDMARAWIAGTANKPYSVTGKTSDELKKSMDDNGPKGLGPDTAGETDCVYDGTTWNPDKFDKTPGEKDCKCKCKTLTADVKLAVTVTFPDWGGYDGASAACKKAWDDFIAALRKHEEGHVKICRDFRDQEEAALKKVVSDEKSGPPDCKDTCNAANQDWLTKCQKVHDDTATAREKAQKEYDAKSPASVLADCK